MAGESPDPAREEGCPWTHPWVRPGWGGAVQNGAVRLWLAPRGQSGLQTLADSLLPPAMASALALQALCLG